MSDPKHRGILVCVDGSAESDAAVAWAAREAAMRGLPITVIHAVAPVVVGWPVGQLYADMPAWQQDGAQQVIDQARKIVIANQRGGTPPEMRTEIIYSAVTPTLIDASRDAWMIVAGSQGLGALGRLLLGSVTAALLAHAHCPVAVVHTDDHAARAADAPVLVGTDGSPARRPRSPWRSTKRLAGASAWWRYTPGATSACFPFSAWTGATARRRARNCWPSGWPAGRNSTRTCM